MVGQTTSCFCPSTASRSSSFHGYRLPVCILRVLAGVSGWSLLICLSSSERSCLRRMSLSHLQRHQIVSIGQSELSSQSHDDSPVCRQVNLLPGLMEAFSDAGGGLCHLFTGSQLSGESLRKAVTCAGELQQVLLLTCSFLCAGSSSGSQVNMRPFSCGPTNETLLFGVNR